MEKSIVSKQVEQMPWSGIRVFFDLVLGMKDVISLGVGEPDFVTPWNIREAGIYSIESGYTSYTSNKGLLELRQELARYLYKKHGLEYDVEEEMLITVGVSEGFDLTLRAIIEPGDKVLIPRPCYVSYGPLVELQGGRAVYLDTKIDCGFKVTPKQLESAIDRRTKALLLNYPCNPTGASYKKKELEALYKIARKNGLIIISDEIYADLTYDFAHTPLATLSGAKERTVYLNGFSKAFAMTGWRIGYACGPKEIISAMTKIHQYTMMCVPIASQMAAIEALRRSDKSVLDMKKEYKRRRALVVSGLNEMGLSCHMPEGAFYVFPSIKKSGMSSVDFASKLLQEEKVAVVPGTAFSPMADDNIRISYASSLDNLKEAMARIGNFLKSR